jgi:hypothetical protein
MITNATTKLCTTGWQHQLQITLRNTWSTAAGTQDMTSCHGDHICHELRVALQLQLQAMPHHLRGDTQQQGLFAAASVAQWQPECGTTVGQELSSYLHLPDNHLRHVQDQQSINPEPPPHSCTAALSTTGRKLRRHQASAVAQQKHGSCMHC